MGGGVKAGITTVVTLALAGVALTSVGHVRLGIIATILIAAVSGAFTLSIGHLLSARMERAGARVLRGQKALVRAQGGFGAGDQRLKRQEDERSVLNHLGGDPWTLTATQWWARRLISGEIGLGSFVKLAKRTRSRGALDVLAYAATAGAFGARELAERVNGGANHRGRRLIKDAAVKWNAPAYLGFMQAIATQKPRIPNAEKIALEGYGHAVREFGLPALSDVDRSIYGDLLTRAGNTKEARRILVVRAKDTGRRRNQALLVANTMNPHASGDGTEQEWLALINRMYVENDLAGIELREGEAEPFYRLTGAGTRAADPQSVLVSVIMPIYEPNDETDVAIASVLSQTWRNLELIIVDDGSPASDSSGQETDYVERLKRWASQSDRIRLVLNEENRGAYWARNVGYSLAQGKYVTIVDKDDWHHPQRIETQVRYMEREGAPVACLANWARVDRDLRFIVRWGPDRVIHPSFACAMFRREEVQKVVGFWDTVRKGADNEFLERVQLAFDFKIETVSPAPLALSFLGDGNLTASDMGMGFESHSRQVYRQAYSGWHGLQQGGGSLYLEMNPDARSFPAPLGFLPSRDGILSCDVIYVADFRRQPRASYDSILVELAELTEAGYSIGMIEIDDPMQRGNARHTQELDRLATRGLLARISTTDSVVGRVGIVRTPRAMQIDQFLHSSVSVERAVIVADQAPFEYTTGERHYDASVVASNVQLLLGHGPQWAPVSHNVAVKLRSVVDSSQILEDWSGVADFLSTLNLAHLGPDSCHFG
ncbi:hypothetical protein GCM10007967_22690 [Xylanimonas ulmi]